FFAANRSAHVISPPPAASRPDMMLSAGVAELVDALDLGSSDESCGGSSPSARTILRSADDLTAGRLAGSANRTRSTARHKIRQFHRMPFTRASFLPPEVWREPRRVFRASSAL